MACAVNCGHSIHPLRCGAVKNDKAMRLAITGRVSEAALVQVQPRDQSDLAGTRSVELL
jgi:hypothetical protein